MALFWPAKDSNEVLDYEIVWTRRLSGDTITDSQWEVVDEDALIIDSSEFTTKTAKIWLSGGVDGETYYVLNRIITAGGRTMDQTVRLKIKPK